MRVPPENIKKCILPNLAKNIITMKGIIFNNSARDRNQGCFLVAFQRGTGIYSVSTLVETKIIPR